MFGFSDFREIEKIIYTGKMKLLLLKFIENSINLKKKTKDRKETQTLSGVKKIV